MGIDLSALTGSVVSIGGSLLGVAVVILGFEYAAGMLVDRLRARSDGWETSYHERGNYDYLNDDSLTVSSSTTSNVSLNDDGEPIYSDSGELI